MLAWGRVGDLPLARRDGAEEETRRQTYHATLEGPSQGGVIGAYARVVLLPCLLQ